MKINRLLILATALGSLISCSPKKYAVYQFDNGDDYYCEGLRRIVGEDGRIGFENEQSKVVITPRYAFAFPFADGVSKATDSGHSERDGEYSRWVSPEWFYIDHEGNRLSADTVLARYIKGKDARIGVSVLLDGEEFASYNGNRDFPMLSVYKFPQAIAVAEFCRKNGVNFSDTVSIAKNEILENTWSPMREKYGVRDLHLPVSELLDFSIRQSDNNACDILFRLIGGPGVADSVVGSLVSEGIIISDTEAEMHEDIYRCYLNRSTPRAMTELIEKFYSLKDSSDEYKEIAYLLENCTTGTDRLARPLSSAGAVIGHKTGTGDVNSQGRIIGVNDVGYVLLPDGRKYTIAVFIADSAYDMTDTASMIADISDIIYTSVISNR